MIRDTLSLPSTTAAAVAVSLVVVSMVVVWYAVSWYRLRHIPGPVLGSVSYLWMFIASVRGRQAQDYRHLHRTYGGASLVRIGPRDVISDDPDVLRRMGAARSPYLRSSWYRAIKLNPHGETMFTMTDSAAHDRLKAQMAMGYGGKDNPTLERDIDDQLVALVRLIRTKYISAPGTLRPLDLADPVQYFTLDVITKVAHGKEFGFLERDEDVYNYNETVKAVVPFAAVLADLPFLGTIFLSPWIVRLIGPKKTDKTGMGKLLLISEQVVAERFGPDKKERADMLGSFVRQGVSKEQCELELPFQIMAGSDSTAAVIRGTMLQLMSSRTAYTKLQAEIDAGLAAGRISSPVTGDEAKAMEYLQAVLYEGLRMHYPFSGLMMKEVPPGGDVIDGHFVPAGTRVGQNMAAIQRNRGIYGDDADIFRPERWLEGDAAHRQTMLQTTELVFGYGRWGCSGRPIAMLELNKVFVELLRYFDFRMVDPSKPWVTTNRNVFFHSDMWVMVTERGVGKDV